MNEYINLITRIRNLFDELNRLSFWQRIFHWKTFKKDFYEGAKEDLVKLEFIQQQNSEITLDLDNEKRKTAELESKLNREKESVATLNQGIKANDKTIAGLKQKNDSDLALIKKLEAENYTLNEKILELSKLNSALTQKEEQRQAEQKEHIKTLGQSTKITDETRQQLIADDQRLKEEKEANRSRVWKEHEDRTNVKLQSSCGTSEYLFKYFDNKNPPEALSQLKLAPDFCFEFCDEYVIFDSKTPTSPESNFDEYIKEQVKQSAKKYAKATQHIHKSIFFVIPSEEISKIKETVYKESSFKFHIITPESIEPILSNYKKIEGYEIAEKLNPEDREELISLIAKYDNHIMRRNQVDLFLIDHGFQTMGAKMSIPEDFRNAIDEKQNIELINPSPQKRRKKISLEITAREHQRLSDEAKVKSLPPLATIEYQEID